MKKMKKTLSLLLALSLTLSGIPFPATAEETCPHHIHDESLCGYVEAAEGSPCTHRCGEDCQSELAEDGVTTLCLTHTCPEGDCGYVAAVEGSDCTYVCEECASEATFAAEIAEVKALIDALPDVNSVMAMPIEEQATVYNQVQNTYEAYKRLTEEQKAQLPTPEEIFEPLFSHFNALIDTDAEIASGTPDGTAPVLTGLTISATTVTVPGEVEVIAEASDDVSGVYSVYVEFYCMETKRWIDCSLSREYWDESVYVWKPYADGKWHGTLKVNQYLESGTFLIRNVYIGDRAGNTRDYVRDYNSSYYDDSCAPLPDYVQSLKLEITESDTPDSTAPELESLTIASTAITAPGEVEVIAEASDDVSGVYSIYVEFYCKETKRWIDCSLSREYWDESVYVWKPYADGKWHGTLKVNQYLESGTFLIRNVYIGDRAGNTRDYVRDYNSSYYDDSCAPLPDYVQSLKLEITESDTPDSTAPELESLTIASTAITAPGEVEVIAEASDDVSGVYSIYVEFYCKETKRWIDCSLSREYWDESVYVWKPYADGKWHGTLKVNQYLESGTFLIRNVYIGDRAGNTRDYVRDYNSSYYDDSCAPLPDAIRSLAIAVTNTGADIITSVSNSAFVSEVTNAADDSYIVADFSGDTTLPQEAFDGIKGTNKTLDLTSEGVTWRFEGSDIVNAPKDIELNVTISKVEEVNSGSGAEIEDKLEGNPGVVMKFAENGELPGKATIQVKVDYSMRQYLGSSDKLSVYYYNNQTGKLELVAEDLTVINDTYVEFSITHCSYYVLTAEKKELVKNRVVLDSVDNSASFVWIDGVQHTVQTQGGFAYVDLPEGAKASSMITYGYHIGDAGDVHTQYPVSMKVWALKKQENGSYSAERVEQLDDILQYSGSSIRITGNKGIRMITSIEAGRKEALINGNLAGYRVMEYGTVLALAGELEGGKPLTLGQSYARSNYAYKRGVADPVFAVSGNLVQYTNVLVGFTLDQCREDIAMRSYMILEDAQGNQVTLYGGTVYRSIGYIAYQNRNVFAPGNAAYDYVWEIIHHVYGDRYDADYKS